MGVSGTIRNNNKQVKKQSHAKNAKKPRIPDNPIGCRGGNRYVDGFMVLWFYGVCFLWFYIFMVLWLYVLWFYSFVVLWCYGFVVYGFMVLWFYGFVVLWFMVLWL